MIIHSIVPTEQIFPTDDQKANEQYRIVNLSNIKAEVRLIEEDLYEIQRIYSTDVRDYLRPELQPGMRIRVNFEADNHFLHKNQW